MYGAGVSTGSSCGSGFTNPALPNLQLLVRQKCHVARGASVSCWFLYVMNAPAHVRVSARARRDTRARIHSHAHALTYTHMYPSCTNMNTYTQPSPVLLRRTHLLEALHPSADEGEIPQREEPQDQSHKHLTVWGCRGRWFEGQGC
jgi:hypothetical protein